MLWDGHFPTPDEIAESITLDAQRRFSRCCHFEARPVLYSFRVAVHQNQPVNPNVTQEGEQ